MIIKAVVCAVKVLAGGVALAEGERPGVEAGWAALAPRHADPRCRVVGMQGALHKAAVTAVNGVMDVTAALGCRLKARLGFLPKFSFSRARDRLRH